MKTVDYVMLPDGRKLAYAEYGALDGRSVLYFHGSPSSRLEPLLYGEALFSGAGLRLIAPDRPGMGRSDPQSERGFSDWPRDVLALADHLGLDRFSVLGNSGGCGYVAACAALIPERLHAAVVVSGAWRMDWPEAKDSLPAHLRLFWTLAGRAPVLLGAILQMMRYAYKARRDHLMAQQEKSLPAADYAVMAQPGRMDAFVGMYNEALAQGVKGPIWDLRLYVRPWDFDIEAVAIPLYLFHGEQDPQAPVALVRRMADGMPTARLVTYPDDGHLSTFVSHFGAITQALTGVQ